MAGKKLAEAVQIVQLVHILENVWHTLVWREFTAMAGIVVEELQLKASTML